jgi:hypothetical protein
MLKKLIKSIIKREPKTIESYLTKQNELCLMLDNLQNNVLKGVK